MITIIPAIDIKDGKCVRLRQGRADDQTVYSDDPVAMAVRWRDEGCEFLHVVDLDGAFRGAPVNTELIGRIAAAIDVPVEVGGGLRTEEHIAALMDLGVARAVLGTRACADPASLESLTARFGNGVAVGIDARDGAVQVRGWVETTDVLASELARRVEEAGVKTIIYTDTATDGMMTGPNCRAVADICDTVSCDVIASGGIVSCDDIEALCDLKRPNLSGAIVGKALYEGCTSLAELTEAARGRDSQQEENTVPC